MPDLGVLTLSPLGAVCIVLRSHVSCTSIMTITKSLLTVSVLAALAVSFVGKSNKASLSPKDGGEGGSQGSSGVVNQGAPRDPGPSWLFEPRTVCLLETPAAML